MANIFKIKRRTSGAAGAPASLANGELAFNEVNNSLYYGKPASVPAIGGAGDFTTVDTSQTLSGSKTFSSSVVLSSAVAETKATATSAASVATTQFVQNVFSLLDGGDFDGAGAPNTSGFVILGTGGYLTGTSFNDPANWTFNGQSTATLPTSSDVVTINTFGNNPGGNDTVLIDIDQWVEPSMIVVQNGAVAVKSLQGRSFSVSVLSGSNYTLYALGNAIITN